MNNKLIFINLLACLILPISAIAENHPIESTIECKNRPSWVDQAVCNDAKLSDLNTEIERYLKPADEKEQAAWKKSTYACQDMDCLTNYYATRVFMLKQKNASH